MNLFNIISWFLCIFTAFLLLMVLKKYRLMLIKPSIIVIIFFHLQVQWAATLEASYVESFLLDPIPFLVLVHGFPLIGLLGSYVTLRKRSAEVWNRVTSQDLSKVHVPYVSIFLLVLVISASTLWYLSSVPVQETGLYAIVYNPEGSDVARELSWKLLPNVGLRYAYSLTSSSFALLLAAIMGMVLFRGVRRRKLVEVIGAVVMILILMVVVSFPGTRIGAARLVMVVLLSYFYVHGFPTTMGYYFRYLSCVIIVLGIPAILSIMRSGNELNFGNIINWLFIDGIFQRTFEAPMKAGLSYVDYAQRHGFFGIAGIPKLAAIAGIKAVNVPNIIGLAYERATVGSITAPTSYVFAYYAYFGLISFCGSLVALWLLDMAVLVYGMISDGLVIPCVASIFVASLSFVDSDFTTTLLTHGFGVVLIVTVLLDCIRVRISCAGVQRGIELSESVNRYAIKEH